MTDREALNKALGQYIQTHAKTMIEQMTGRAITNTNLLIKASEYMAGVLVEAQPMVGLLFNEKGEMYQPDQFFEIAAALVEEMGGIKWRNITFRGGDVMEVATLFDKQK